MKNIIKHCAGIRQNIIVFDDVTMTANFYYNEDQYSVTTGERKISFGDYNKVPKVIANIVIDEMTEEKIVIRNRNIRINSTKSYNREIWTGTIEEYDSRNDRVITIDLVNKVMKVEYSKKCIKLDFKGGVSHEEVHKLIRKTFMKFASAVVIPEQDDFFKPFREMFSKSKKYSFILKLKEGNYGLSKCQRINCGYDLSKCILEHNKYDFANVYSATRDFSMQLASVIYMINNPGVESLINSPYGDNLYKEIFYEQKSFPSAKLSDVLNIKKTSLKMLNTITNKISENVTLLGNGANCDAVEIQKIVSNTLYGNKSTIDEAIELMNGYNNLEYLVDGYFKHQFYIDYLSGLRKYYYHVTYYDNKEEGARLQFNRTINDVVSNICSMIMYVNILLHTEPRYLNNINYFADYITQIGRKQGYQSIANGISLLIDYIKMQKSMNAEHDKYPVSISLMHDISANNHRFFDNSLFKNHCGKFADAVAAYADLDYINKQEKYIVIHPNGFEELFVEGCSLNHCVASYIPDVASRLSKIMLIRKSEERNVPYFTVEIKDNRIKQVKGVNQVNPTEKSLLDFISTWAEKRHLIEDYI